MQTLKLKKTTGYDENDNEIFDEKIYTSPNPKAIVLRNALEITETMDAKNLTVKDFDLLVEFAVNLFGKKFTADDVWNGIDANKIGITLINCIYGVVGELGDKLKQVPNGAAE